MKPSEDEHAHSRPSYLGVGITLPERDEPQETDDIRTNLSERFSLFGDAESDTTPFQKSAAEPKEHMHVYLRVRPFTASEVEQNESQDCVSIPDACSVLVKAPHHSQASRLSEKGGSTVAQKFTFTNVFGPETTQSQFFDGTLKKQVLDFMKGHNRLIFTYGVTNAGKTFTFQGTQYDAGILPRSMEMLFNTIEGKVYSKMDIKPHRCRDYIRLTKEQIKTETAFKNSVLRHTKEVDPQCSIRSNNSRTSGDTTDLLADDGLANYSRVLSECEERLRESEGFSLDVDESTKFSVWVSFCEIYNECIYDLLDPVSGDRFYKRKTLKLSQDIKGFSFVKDLQWIQVSNAKEACKILALGKKFQSIAFTKLNSSSSRSHSIFTVRLLRIEDVEVPRVVRVSELALCDLAGSERCTKTQNEGERLKESGNINTSLLILGKCINALKNSQHSKIQHVPFRESKLTHYLQSFFSGKGKVCMIVNISQSASAYDETLNVLKFSAVAQKVLVLESSQSTENSQAKSAREVSFIINNADNKMWLSRRRATVQWDSHLENVLEDENDEFEENCEDEECLDCTNLEEQDDDEEEEEEILIKKETYEKLLELVNDLKTQLVNEKRDKLVMEFKIRDDVTKEFTQHYVQREHDFRECLQKEKELMEERCDERMEILQDLVRKCSNEEEDEENDVKETDTVTDTTVQVDEPSLPLQGLFSSMQNDLVAIKKQAVEAHHHIAAIHDDPETVTQLENKLQQVTSELAKTQEELKRKSVELEDYIEKSRSRDLQLEEADKKLSSQRQQVDKLMDMIQEKDTATEKLKDLLAHWEAKCEDYEKTVNDIRGEMAKFSHSEDGSSTSRKRPPEDHHHPQDQPPTKKELVENNDFNMENYKRKKSLENKENMDMRHKLEEVRVEKEQYKAQVLHLNQTIVELKERLASCEEQVIDLKSKNGTISCELQAKKDLASTLQGTVEMLMQEIDHNKQSTASKVAQIKTIQSKLDNFNKNESKADSEAECLNLSDTVQSSFLISLTSGGSDSLVEKMGSLRESAFYNAIEGLWRKCQEVLKESSKKNKQIQNLEKELVGLKNNMAELQKAKDTLQVNLQEAHSQGSVLKEKEQLIIDLQKQLSETSNDLERHKKQEMDYKNEVLLNSQQIKDLGLLVDSYREKWEKLSSLENETKEKSVAFLSLEEQLADLQAEHMNCGKQHQKLAAEKDELQKKIKQGLEELSIAENAKNEREKQITETTKEMELVKKDLSKQTNQLQAAQLDLQRKEEDYAELKEKLADAKKQMQQVEKEVSWLVIVQVSPNMTSSSWEHDVGVKVLEALKHPLNPSDILDFLIAIASVSTSQGDVSSLFNVAQAVPEQRDTEKNGGTMQLYQKACQDVDAKEKIIEDMKLTLIEQEQTQEEQDQALEAKVEEAEKLAEELELWKQKYRELAKISSKEILTKLSCETNNNVETVNSEVTKLQNQLKEFEEKYSNDRKKWLEEKKTLIAQAKESENHRNKEMRKFADDRERFTKQQSEMEQLSAQLAEKDSTLQKWRNERDTLVSALEIQLKSLLSSNAIKEREIEHLKQITNAHNNKDSSSLEDMKRQLAASEATIKKLQKKLSEMEPASSATTAGLVEKSQTPITEQPESANLLGRNNSKGDSSLRSDVSTSDSQLPDGSDTVLDSSMISTENGKTSRFPKPQMEISFSPAKPNKMEIKHHGDDSPITVRITRTARKRKSAEMAQHTMLSSCWKIRCKESEGTRNICRDTVKIENRKNTRTNKMIPSTMSSPAINSNESKKQMLTKQLSTSSTTSSRKKDGTLQKLGEFLQSSPSIFQNKAKKLLGTIAAPKTTNLISGHKEEESKPKKNRRKLYTAEISAPLDIPAHAIIMDTNERESDHLIMKRRLRTRTAK
ncbi:PREDICTED: kinesin-like protein KIF20B [Nanorana parkeri]|uniref:kinesin-like protein KIF20B n=1 Tax=Nanorana parkeri TaxID=125878 RepID=UPI0008547E3F|nr:PREDICTED: kinesin-like protein KIF20B [Nanorana parkeri]